MNHRWLLVAVMAAVARTGPGSDALQGRGTGVEIVAADSVRLKGAFFSAGRPGPGLLLLHQCDKDRQSWNGLATALAARGVHVLTFDHRGYGENSTLARRGGTTPPISADIDAAFRKLRSMPGVNVARLAAGGASCGVDWSIRLAMRDSLVRALVLLSGTTTPEGLAFVSEHGTLPIFGAASDDDGDVVQHTARILHASRHPASTMRELKAGGHGVPMFDADSSLMPAIVEWLVSALR